MIKIATISSTRADFGLLKNLIKKLNRNKGRYRGNKKKDYSLDGRVFCGCCNSSMWIIGGNSYNYFKCSNKINEKRKQYLRYNY